MSYAKWRPFCRGLDGLKILIQKGPEMVYFIFQEEKRASHPKYRNMYSSGGMPGPPSSMGPGGMGRPSLPPHTGAPMPQSMMGMGMQGTHSWKSVTVLFHQ